jgi:hypothetical protein
VEQPSALILYPPHNQRHLPLLGAALWVDLRFSISHDALKTLRAVAMSAVNPEERLAVSNDRVIAVAKSGRWDTEALA